MAAKKNKLEKLGVLRALVETRADDGGHFSHPSIGFMEDTKDTSYNRMFTINYQRNRLDLDGSDLWSRNREVEQARVISGGALDVGRAAYGTSYAGRLNEIEVWRTERVASVINALLKVEVECRGEADELLLMVERLHKLGVPVQWRYYANGMRHDHAWELHDDLKDRCRLLVNSAAAKLVEADWLAKRADDLRAATAQAEVA